jgi:hypothetical protein
VIEDDDPRLTLYRRLLFKIDAFRESKTKTLSDVLKIVAALCDLVVSMEFDRPEEEMQLLIDVMLGPFLPHFDQEQMARIHSWAAAEMAAAEARARASS